MNSDLMHPPSVGSAEHNAARSIEAQSLKLGPALFPSPSFTYFRFHKNQSTGQTKKTHCIPGDLADSNLVAEHFYWFSAVNHPPGAQQCGNNNLFELTLEMSRPPCRRTPWSPGGKPIVIFLKSQDVLAKSFFNV